MKIFDKELKLSRNLFLPAIDKNDTRSGYGEGVVIAGDTNEDIVVLTADLTDSTKSRNFANKYPQRFFEVGVAEQNLAGIAAGLGLSGKIPFMASYAVFSPGRNWDQIRVSICFSNSNVKIVSSHAGFGTGPDGPTHIALEDIAMLRALPNITIVSPADFYEAKKAVVIAAQTPGPFYIRLTRAETPVFTTEETPFEIGKAQQLTEGKDITIIATGNTVYDSLLVAKKLKDTQNISCEVINCSTIKPLDKKTILDSASKTKKVVTVEEHQIYGGLGGAIAELLATELPTHMKILGVQDTFTESGGYEELKYKYGINIDRIEKAVLDFTKEK
jgi:transketolase